MSHTFKKLASLTLALCMLLTSVSALASCGDMEAKGHFYAD